MSPPLQTAPAPPPDASQQVRWLYADFNSYFASVEQQANPALRGKPIIVVPVMTDATCAIAASVEAKTYGIKTGMPVWEAKRKCPQVKLVLADHKKYVETHNRIVQTVEDKCLHVSAVCSIDEIACQLGGSERQPEKAKLLVQNIKRELALSIGPHIRCSIGLAPNRFLAKVACDIQKPDGLSALTPADLPGPLLRFKLRDLPGIGPNMERRLNAASVGSMADLWALEPKEMRGIWGSLEGERYWMYLHGIDTPAIETHRSSIGHSRVLDPHHRPPLEAYKIARHLLLKAAVRLRREKFMAQCLAFSARIDKGSRFAGALRFSASQDLLFFLQVLETLWQALQKNHAGQHIKKVSLVFFDLLPENEVTLDLFARPVARRMSGNLSRAVDQLVIRYGPEMLGFGWKGETKNGLKDFGTKIAFTRVPDMAEFVE